MKLQNKSLLPVKITKGINTKNVRTNLHGILFQLTKPKEIKCRENDMMLTRLNGTTSRYCSF